MGAYAVNRWRARAIWVADYVMMGYGTGAIMAVPGDERDFGILRSDWTSRAVINDERQLARTMTGAYAGPGMMISNWPVRERSTMGKGVRVLPSPRSTISRPRLSKAPSPTGCATGHLPPARLGHADPLCDGCGLVPERGEPAVVLPTDVAFMPTGEVA